MRKVLYDLSYIAAQEIRVVYELFDFYMNYDTNLIRIVYTNCLYDYDVNCVQELLMQRWPLAVGLLFSLPGCCWLGVARGNFLGWSGVLWWLWLLRGPGFAHWALLGGVWSVLLGGGVAALWSRASLVCRAFP